MLAFVLVHVNICIPGRKSVWSRRHRRDFHFGRDNLKNILVRPLKFGMWVYMGNATHAIVL